MNLQSELNSLSSTLKEIASLSTYSGSTNTKVSSVSVGWHIQHIYLATSQMAEYLRKSIAADYRYRPNISRTFVFSTKKIPRGKGKAPKASQPIDIPEAPELSKQVLRLSETITDLSSLEYGKHFQHYIFGTLNRDHTVKLMGIHARHHLGIIREILNTKN